MIPRFIAAVPTLIIVAILNWWLPKDSGPWIVAGFMVLVLIVALAGNKYLQYKKRRDQAPE